MYATEALAAGSKINTGLLLTDSRAAWVAFICGSAFFCYWMVRPLRYRKKIFIYGLLIFVTVLFFMVLPSSIKKRVMTIADKNVNINRISLWKKSFIIIDNHPLFGTGLNTYAQVSPHYYVPRAGNEYPHNSYLHMAAEIGVLGLCSFLWMVVTLFWCGIVALKNRGDPLLNGYYSGITAYLVQSFFDTNVYSLQLGIFFWIIIGITLSYLCVQMKDESV